MEDAKFKTFLSEHKPQLVASNIPKKYWQTLFLKLENEVFNAGSAFSLLQVTDEGSEGEEDGEEERGEDTVTGWMVVVSAEDGVNIDDPNNVYLIDHAWTYRANEARRYLVEVPGLLQRMAAMFDLETGGVNPEQLTESVLHRSWRFSQTYRFGNVSSEDDESLEPRWYILDEFGSRIQHSDSPTCRCVPFYFTPSKTTFTVMWPTANLQCQDELTRDLAEGVTLPLMRRAKLLPWIEDDFEGVDWRQKERDESYYQSYTRHESWPDPAAEQTVLPSGRKIRVWTDIAQLQRHLTDERFEVVECEETADVLWTKEHFKNYRELSLHRPHVLVNQFPAEILFTCKDPLAVIARHAGREQLSDLDNLHGNPRWLPVTYNLQTELTEFVAYYKHRQRLEADNHWILKPWNMARGLDMHITSDLAKIIRLADSGPKVACKYIHPPVLFEREEIGEVKFDVRYIVLLASTSPLKLYVYRVFWLRFANKPYSLDHFDDYEKHFTVMNYQEGVTLKQVHYDEFIPMFDKQYPDYPWDGVEVKIFSMFKELFAAAVQHPHGIPASPQSRAIYAIDLMLQWEKDKAGERVIEPMLCEVNFCPDCERACKYHPNFYNDIFSALLLEDITDRPVTLL